MFAKPSTTIRKVVILFLIALGMMTIHSYTNWFRSIEKFADWSIRPVYWIANIPPRIGEWADLRSTDRSVIEKENLRLKQESLIYRGQLQRMAELAAENLRLRLLLNATELLTDSILVTAVIGVSPSPKSHTLSIDRGLEDGVYVGQPILDAEGLMGQIISVFDNHSVALLLTDNTHAIPVQVLRNGMRSIAEGTSDYNNMQLQFLSLTADIREGDELVSSGLGGRFPPGYPVGSVLSIEKISGDEFLEVNVRPAAKIDRSKHLLLVFTSQDGKRNGNVQ
ncbi:MAG TPA: rod shape-determining protein MreC [Porticoccaceae bacterium]|nr:rod shape-determining protein MreC [Porticoccaceae bacterium]HIK80440.1 rod shape-determining protein MreC [Porticoccaceae bacterium]